MRLAILGATSQIAKDLILSFMANGQHQLSLFSRRPEAMTVWLEANKLHASALHSAAFEDFSGDAEYDAIINFVGVGNPAQAVQMGASIFDVTLKYDAMALSYLQSHPHCRYIFLSSGAAYGSSFQEPVTRSSQASVALNDFQPHDWYAMAKLYAECRHRALPDHAIVDVRVFNYFSRTQDMSARFLISDILRAIRDDSVLMTSADYIVRDYMSAIDFSQLINAVLNAPPENAALDCYSLEPVDKPALLAAMQQEFGLKYEISKNSVAVNATGGKPYYYSLNKRAADFGYRPSMTSLQGVLQAARAILATPREAAV